PRRRSQVHSRIHAAMDRAAAPASDGSLDIGQRRTLGCGPSRRHRSRAPPAHGRRHFHLGRHRLFGESLRGESLSWYKARHRYFRRRFEQSRPAEQARDEAVRTGIRINGLPILAGEPDLDQYFRQNVIGGPGAFVIAVKSYDQFAEAILRKLITEISLRTMKKPLLALK